MFRQSKLFLERKELPQIEPAPIRSSFKDFMWDDSSGYAAEEKLDGARFLMFIEEGENRFSSRHKSIKDGKFSEKTDNFPHLRNLDLSKLSGTVLDGEIVTGKNVTDVMSVVGGSPSTALRYQMHHGWVKYIVFDILKYKGKDVTSEWYKDRRYLLHQLFSNYINYIIIHNDIHSLKLINSVEINKKGFYETILKDGGEGIVLKKLISSYGEDWIKVKKESTYDVVIIGFEDPEEMTTKSDGTFSRSRLAEKNLIGSIKFGQYNNGILIPCGSCSGISDKMRTEFSNNSDEFLGQVMTIKAQERTESGAFRHPVFVRMRSDKNPEDCIYYPNEC